MLKTFFEVFNPFNTEPEITATIHTQSFKRGNAGKKENNGNILLTSKL
jgi:hypothetical protein